jgi:hypothetical protein
MCPPFNQTFAWHRRRRLLRMLAVLTIVFLGATTWFALEMDDHGPSILELQFVRTSDKAEEYSRLSKEWKSDAQASLGIGYGLLVSYGLLLVGLSVAIRDRSLRKGRLRLASLGPWVAWAALGAATYDAVENALLLLIIDGVTSNPWPAIATGCAVAKFSLAGIAVLYAVIGWLRTLGVRPEPSLARS